MAESWAERYAAALQARAGIALSPGALTPSSIGRLLVLARDVAHGSERRNAPLATYVAGAHVALRVAQGADATAALAEAAAVAADLLGEEAAAAGEGTR